MRNALIAAVSALILAACGGGGSKQALVKSCMDEGESRENCTCMADKAEETLDADLLGKMARASSEGEEGMQALMSELTQEQTGQFMAFGLAVATACQVNF